MSKTNLFKAKVPIEAKKETKNRQKKARQNTHAHMRRITKKRLYHLLILCNYTQTHITDVRLRIFSTHSVATIPNARVYVLVCIYNTCIYEYTG